MLTVARAAARPPAPRRSTTDELAAVVARGGRGARDALAAHPATSSRCCAGRGSSTPAAAGSACCSTRWRRSSPATPPAPTAAPARPPESDTARPRRGLRRGDPDAHGAGVRGMYLLDAARPTPIPPLRAALDPLGDSLVVVGGEPTWNVHVHVDDVGAAVEAGIEAGRPYRIRVTHFRDAAPRGGRRRSAPDEPQAWSRSVPATGWPRCSRPPAPPSSTAGPGARAPRPASCSPAIRAARARDVVRAAQRRRQPRGRRGRGRQGARRGPAGGGDPDPGQRAGDRRARRARRGPPVRGRRRRDDRGRRALPPRRGHRRRPGGGHDGRRLPAGRRARHHRRRLRRDRRRPGRGRAARSSTGCWRRAASWSPSSPGADADPALADGRGRRTCARTRPESTPWSTTGASRATRCSSGSSERGAAWSRRRPVRTVGRRQDRQGAGRPAGRRAPSRTCCATTRGATTSAAS